MSYLKSIVAHDAKSGPAKSAPNPGFFGCRQSDDMATVVKANCTEKNEINEGANLANENVKDIPKPEHNGWPVVFVGLALRKPILI